MTKDDYLCDIIIITYNGLDYTKKCVESIERNTQDVKYRYIFIDNNSTDNTLEYLGSIKNSVLISNSENLGFAKAMNQGFEKVSSKYVIWLNNDTIVTPHWLRYLIDHLEKHSTAVAIGPVSNATGLIQKIDEFDEEETIESISEFGKKFHNKNSGKVVEYHRIAGFCIVMKSELISKIGKIDETFNFGGYDDDDYCKRIRDCGYKILIAEDVFVYHKSGATFSRTKDPDFDLAFLMQKGRRRFLRKWVSPKKSENVKNNGPLVSVIMSTKDREKIISRSIGCVINQTYKNWELLIVNDGGRDISDIVEGFSDSRIKYLSLNENHGKSFANNVAIRESKGELIAYLDDDDYWYPNHLEVTVADLVKYESRQLVYTDYVRVDCIVDPTGRQIPTRKEVMTLREGRAMPVEELNFIPNFSMIHKRSLFDLAGTFDEMLIYYEDWDLLRRFSRHAYFVHVPEVTGEYWINQLGITRNSYALVDKNLNNVTSYIKNKNISLSNPILIDLEIADNMISENVLNKALKLYKLILDKDPEFYPVVEGCADRLFTMKKYSEANEYWAKLIEINPFNLSAYLRGAQNLINQGNYQEAKKLLEFALVISDDKSVYYFLQNCYKNLNNPVTSEFIRRKISVTAENISFREIEEFLLTLYNKSYFYRKLFITGYKFLKKITN